MLVIKGIGRFHELCLHIFLGLRKESRYQDNDSDQHEHVDTCTVRGQVLAFRYTHSIISFGTFVVLINNDLKK